MRRVVRLLFHVVAHMYAAHFRELALLRLHAHLHLTFAHLTALDARFMLLDQKETEVSESVQCACASCQRSQSHHRTALPLQVLRDLEVALRLTEPEGGGEEASPRREPVVTQPLGSA